MFLPQKSKYVHNYNSKTKHFMLNITKYFK